MTVVHSHLLDRPHPGTDRSRAQARFRCALALHRIAQLDPAIEAYTEAIRLDPDHADAHHNLGAAFASAGRGPEAIAAWSRALQLRPGQADTIVALGQALLDAHRAEDAAVLLVTACRDRPADARILALNGRALLALGQAGPAIGALFLAIERDPGLAAAHASLGTALFDGGDIDLAIVHSLEAHRLEPTPEHASTLSCVLIAAGRYDGALTAAQDALDRQPDCFEALVNRGLALEGLGRYEDAIAAGRQAVAARPDSTVARMNLAVTLLSMGRMTSEAWDLYEARLHLHGTPAWLSAVTLWDGSALDGRTLLVHAEQGFGDTLQFIRFAPLVAARAAESGGRVIVAVQPALARLFPALPGVAAVVHAGGTLPPFDVVCPLMSLPRLLGTTLDSVPPALPYTGLETPRNETKGQRSGPLRVGLVWAGSKGFDYDRQRSLAPDALSGLAGIPGVQFYSLQRLEPGMAPLPPCLDAIDVMAGVQDFADTAAQVAGLDLVVSVDTAVAHLAATMGKPVWLLSRFRGCWRWLIDRSDSPWYPGMRVVRQDQPNGWTDTITQLRADLVAWAAERNTGLSAVPINDVATNSGVSSTSAKTAGPSPSQPGERGVTKPYVLAFVGENANGMLRWWTERILAGFAAHGLSHQLIDLQNPGWRSNLGDCMAAASPEFCFSFQGLGMDLRLGGDNYWTRNGIPFLSYLGDSPYHAPGLHAAEGPGMYLLYGCADFQHTYRHFLNGRAYASTLRYGYPENPAADRTPWKKREHGIVFVKTGVDPAALSRAWDDLPAQVRDILHDTASRVLSGTDETVATLCAHAFADRQVHWGDRRELFLFSCSVVDRYARAVRADRMVRALMRHDALIVGDWSHVDQSGARARFHAPVAADALDALYAEARITVNTSPTVRSGMHERIMAGLFAKAAVVSDSTPYLLRTLAGCPSFHGIDIDRDTFDDALQRTLQACLTDPDTPAHVERSAAVARELFSFDDFIQQLLDHVGIERHRQTLGGWTFPPAAMQPTQPAAT